MELRNAPPDFNVSAMQPKLQVDTASVSLLRLPVCPGRTMSRPLVGQVGVWDGQPCLEVRRELAVPMNLIQVQSNIDAANGHPLQLELVLYCPPRHTQQ